jgi:hypothetical protein
VGLASRVWTSSEDDQRRPGATTVSEAEPSEPEDVTFPFAFDRRFRLPLALLGVTPSRARVTVTADRLVARYGPWSLETGLDNVADVCVTRGYRWYTAIGARGSFADRGLTFGTNPDAGVCVRFRHAVPGLEPFGLVRHPGLTMTVDDPDALAAALRRRIRPAASGTAPR